MLSFVQKVGRGETLYIYYIYLCVNPRQMVPSIHFMEVIFVLVVYMLQNAFVEYLQSKLLKLLHRRL
jgi:hypothetical protein